jgi:DNA primase catalytic subunit
LDRFIEAIARFVPVLSFPNGMRPSTLEERKAYYVSEFDLPRLTRWIGKRRNHMKLAMTLGRHSGIFMPDRARDKDNVVVIDDWRTAREIRSYAVRYLPEAMYYDRNRYDDVSECAHCGDDPARCNRCYNYLGQQLAFDLDPENVDCPYHGHIGTKMQAGRGLSFCMFEFKAVRRQAFELSSELSERYDKVSVVYSGRGFHVVVDDESAYSLTRKERTSIARKVARRYSIDEWVTIGDSRLMRLPYSLNAIVSRKCMIMKWGRDLLKFDPRTSREVTPQFMRSS